MNRFWTGVRRLQPRAALLGALFAGLAAAVVGALPDTATRGFHERALDALLKYGALARPDGPARTKIVVVDIDRRSLAELGPWPWPRGRIAALVDAAAQSEARAVTIDILFEGTDARSPAALARRLGSQTNRPDIVVWADSLEDGDALLASALGHVPTVLGFALDPRGTGDAPTVPFLIQGPVSLPGIWRAPGAVPPFPPLLTHAAGAGALALAGDQDGLVRRVPLLVAVGGRLHPGLATEAVRLTQGASAYRLGGPPGFLAIGDIVLPVPADGMLRLIPGAAQVTTIPAAELLARRIPDPRLRGAIVMIGGSAPELGGLRPAPGDPLTPSVMLWAEAVSQLGAGIVPRPIPYEGAFNAVLAVSGVLAGLLIAQRLRPVHGALTILGFAALLVLAALAAAAHDRLFDPSPPILVAAAAFSVAALVAATETQVREARIRRRFSQHLAPAVVELIAASPSMLKLAGERREITALFTDVEGFTAMTHRAGPEALVALLDDYFEGVTQIVIDHGGMIDKFVGDAVHAFFNMPLDLPGHPLKAVQCAIAIQAWAESYRKRPFPAEMAFGRTRIGVETGDAVVGDIGIRSKLDYTAHGDTVNSAARFEAANKEIGSAICVGPQAASRCPPDLLRPTGTIQLRGFTVPVRTWEPWAADASPDWRCQYLAADELAETNPACAAAAFAHLAEERSGDAVPAARARQLRDRL